MFVWQVSEGRIIAALRDEVTAAEVRLEEERAAHNTTQRTAAAREQVSLHLHPSFMSVLYCKQVSMQCTYVPNRPDLDTSAPSMHVVQCHAAIL